MVLDHSFRFGSPVYLQIPALALAAVLLAAVGGYGLVVRRRNPVERERRRRLGVNQAGRMAEALITDLTEDCLHYTYSVSGVAYAASQDITSLRSLLPEEPARLVGHATVKYLPRNPANSILLCEDWSGLRKVEQPIGKGA
jgi:hypothetical protein